MEDLFLFLAVIAVFAIVLFVYLTLRHEKIPVVEEEIKNIVITKKITPVEDNLFYVEFYWHGVLCYGYVDHLLTLSMEEMVRYGGLNIKLQCRVEGIEPAETGRWCLTPLEEVADESPKTSN